MDDITKRVRNYWEKRAKDFALIKNNELNDDISSRWINEIEKYLEPEKTLDILDVGTGTGYFAILLSRKGHRVTGIDLTPAMLEEAREASEVNGVDPVFMLMDAQKTDFEDCAFDAVVSRNLTWTLPDPEKAYREWFRVLRPGGVLINFDADYATNVRNQNLDKSFTQISGTYGHIGMTPELVRENAEITLSMPAGTFSRPEWDLKIFEESGFSAWGADTQAGRRILGDRDLSDAALFLVWAQR
ncbi:MAG: methyltransferase domain-containing protein [Eubacteriaceae bacterium]|nr:methyltransferase domain-containing protein [Eubacteriaceae bacterium]